MAESKIVHNLEIPVLASEFSTHLERGLSEEQIAVNRQKYGQNQLTAKKQTPVWKVFIDQYKDLLMIVLLASSCLSLIVGIFPTDGQNWGHALTTIEGWENFILIVAVTIINAILGTVQIIKSRKSLESLKKLSQAKAKVLRNNEVVLIDHNQVVVGDIVLLEAGDIVPADARLISCNNLKINESSLTGESETILKSTALIKEAFVPIGDRLNCVFSGCLVTYGTGVALVTTVGEQTEIGKISVLLNETQEQKTPLQINLDKLAKFLMYAVLIVCGLLFILNISKLAFVPELNVVSGLSVFSETLNFSIALAVAVIPEALSSIITIVLSISTKKMAKNNAIVKELKAVEGLGSVSVICSDKTGTITQNKMTVTDFFVNQKTYAADQYVVVDQAHAILATYAVLCSDAKISKQGEVGDPTEIALLNFLFQHSTVARNDVQTWKRVAVLPFDSQRMMMSTLMSNKQMTVMITKGAVDKMLSRCSHLYQDGETIPLTKDLIKTIEIQNTNLASQGKRILCIGYKPFSQTSLNFENEKDLIFLGLIAMIDPPRPEVIKAIEECHIAGIKVVMITGDHINTAVSIAKQIGIYQPDDWSMNGTVLAAIDKPTLDRDVMKYAVYGRVSPEDKIKIVQAWQSHNMIVAMTGDGVNDAPALKQANIGVAMGITGSEVSKDAASIILTDDNFATIFTAVKMGRSIYNNIKSAIHFLLTGNLATIFIASILTIFSLGIQIIITPFTAIQLLFLNLLTDSWPAISLGLERYRHDVIYDKPRKANDFFINKKFNLVVLYEALIMTVIVVISFLFVYFFATEISDSTMRYRNAAAIAFMTLSFCRLLHGFNCKSAKPVVLKAQFWDNYYLIGSFFLGLILIMLIFYVPGLIPLMFNVAGFSVFNQSMIWVALAFSLLIIPSIQALKYFLTFKKQTVVSTIIH